MALRKSNKSSGNSDIYEEQIQSLQRQLESNGFVVRRENLARGHSFRVKSGKCLFSGSRIVFVDRRLSGEQQVAVLTDYIRSNPQAGF